MAEEDENQGEEECVCPPKPKPKKPPPETCKTLRTCPYDPRFPQQNATRRCYLSFIDYQRCARLLGDYPGCLYFLRCYRALCPDAWVEKWFDQMENGTFPRSIYPSKPIIRPDHTFSCEDEEDDEEPPDVC